MGGIETKERSGWLDGWVIQWELPPLNSMGLLSEADDGMAGNMAHHEDGDHQKYVPDQPAGAAVDRCKQVRTPSESVSFLLAFSQIDDGLP